MAHGVATRPLQGGVQVLRETGPGGSVQWFALLKRHRREEHHDRKALDSGNFVPFNPLIFPADVREN